MHSLLVFFFWFQTATTKKKRMLPFCVISIIMVDTICEKWDVGMMFRDFTRNLYLYMHRNIEIYMYMYSDIEISPPPPKKKVTRGKEKQRNEVGDRTKGRRARWLRYNRRTHKLEDFRCRMGKRGKGKIYWVGGRNCVDGTDSNLFPLFLFRHSFRFLPTNTFACSSKVLRYLKSVDKRIHCIIERRCPRIVQ